MTRAMKTPKKLYILLKMRNFSDLNDLYNAQDVKILLEMMENRFQSMQEKSGYNPIIQSSFALFAFKENKQKVFLRFLSTTRK